MSTATRERIERIADRFNPHGLTNRRKDMVSALTALCEEMEREKPIVPAMYEDDIRELIERILDGSNLASALRRSIAHHALQIMQENKINQEAIRKDDQLES